MAYSISSLGVIVMLFSVSSTIAFFSFSVSGLNSSEGILSVVTVIMYAESDATSVSVSFKRTYISYSVAGSSSSNITGLPLAKFKGSRLPFGTIAYSKCPFWVVSIVMERCVFSNIISLSEGVSSCLSFIAIVMSVFSRGSVVAVSAILMLIT